jgi:serine/threonine protein kinase
VTFGGFELLAQIGRGGTGTVYRARDPAGRFVAIKLMNDGRSPADVRRFREQAAAAVRLRHPSIVGAFDAGEIDGRPYIAMELVENIKPILHWAEHWRSPPRAIARVIAKVARAVDYGHQRGIYASDLAAGDVLIDEQGEPHVIGFRIAQDEPRTDAPEPCYPMRGWRTLAPEERLGEPHAPRAYTAAADIFRLGLLLYEAVTGTQPITWAIFTKGQPIRPPRAVNGRADRRLEKICLRCLETDPELRYRSASAVADDVERACRDGWIARAIAQYRARPRT